MWREKEREKGYKEDITESAECESNDLRKIRRERDNREWQTDRQTYKQRDRETYIHTDRQIDRQIDK